MTHITLVSVSCTSGTDDCKTLLCGRAEYNINRLQRMQNGAARMVTHNGKYSHVKIVL